MKRPMPLLYSVAVATRSAAWVTSRNSAIRTRALSTNLVSKLVLPRQCTNSWSRLRSFSDLISEGDLEFRPGDKIQVEVLSFGPLGASVDVIGRGHNDEDLIPETEPALAKGLILQKEIHFFREARDGIDVVRGEVLPAYVERVREETGRIDISLRSYGGKAKADEVAQQIMDRLKDLDGVLPVGDKSPPEDIGREFPGVSKGSFKKAVAALYRQGMVQPGPDSVTLLD